VQGRECRPYCTEHCFSLSSKKGVIDPKYVEAWINKGNALSKLEKYDEAILSLQKYIKLTSLQETSEIENAKQLIQEMKDFKVRS